MIVAKEVVVERYKNSLEATFLLKVVISAE
jgi:hypothetical protein